MPYKYCIVGKNDKKMLLASDGRRKSYMSVRLVLWEDKAPTPTDVENILCP